LIESVEIRSLDEICREKLLRESRQLNCGWSRYDLDEGTRMCFKPGSMLIHRRNVSAERIFCSQHALTSERSVFESRLMTESPGERPMPIPAQIVPERGPGIRAFRTTNTSLQSSIRSCYMLLNPNDETGLRMIQADIRLTRRCFAEFRKSSALTEPSGFAHMEQTFE
jgi:hypothetical protein